MTLRKFLIISLKTTFYILISFAILVMIWWLWPERTPRIHSDSNNSVSSIEYIKIGGIEQCVLIRAHSTDNPILLFLHGGPGMPMMFLAHEFQRPLEKDFVVVQWDRRGAGKTYARNKSTVESMNVKQIIDDAYTLIDTLRNRYHQDKINLIGHSFGAYLGSIMVSQRPELFNAYISVGQVVDSEKARTIQKDFIRKQAKQNDRDDILKKLDSIEKPNFEGWLFEFGGELKDSKTYFPFIWTGLQAPEYTLKEVLSVAKGSSFSSQHMKYNVLDSSIYHSIREYQVPVYFFVGKFDFTTPFELTEEYYNIIKAPQKEMIYFDQSAHFPFFEEPEKFCIAINNILINEVMSPNCPR